MCADTHCSDPFLSLLCIAPVSTGALTRAKEADASHRSTYSSKKSIGCTNLQGRASKHACSLAPSGLPSTKHCVALQSLSAPQCRQQSHDDKATSRKLFFHSPARKHRPRLTRQQHSSPWLKQFTSRAAACSTPCAHASWRRAGASDRQNVHSHLRSKAHQNTTT